MSKCMTIDETIDQKETCAELNVRDIVEFILEEALNAADLFIEKDCSHIGDFNITEDFCQQFDQIPAYSKESKISKLTLNGNSSTANQEINLDSGESIDRSISILTARENLELILDSFIKKDDKVKNLNECKVISEETLADNELRIENGQIHIKNKPDEENKSFLNGSRVDFFDKKDVIKDEKIEIEYFNDGKLNKIYVPLIKVDTDNYYQNEAAAARITNEVSDESYNENVNDNTENVKKSFTPCNTEELRQVWKNAKSSIVGEWNEDMTAQSKEVVRLMVELSSTPAVFQDVSADPNRPRACAFAEEDVKKMTKEIEEISFNQSHLNSNDVTAASRSDGKGDSVLKCIPFINNNEEQFEKSLQEQKKENPEVQNIMQNEPLPGVSNANWRQMLENESNRLLNEHFFENNNVFERENQKKEVTFISNSTSNPVVCAEQTDNNISLNKSQNDLVDDGNDLNNSQASYTIFAEEKIIENKISRVICSTSQNAMQFHFQPNIDDKSSTLLSSCVSKNLNESQTEIKETEILSKDYSAHPDVTTYSLKEYHYDEYSNALALPEDQDEAVYKNQEKEGLNNNLYSLSKFSEAPLNESSSIQMKEKKIFSENTNLTFYQGNLFSNKTGNEIADPEKMNQINNDSSYDSYLFTCKPKNDLEECMDVNSNNNNNKSKDKDMQYNSFLDFQKEKKEEPNYFKEEQFKITESNFKEYFKDEKLNNDTLEELKKKKESPSVAAVESGPSQLCLTNRISESDFINDYNIPEKNFKLHSQKMYYGANIDPASSNKPYTLISNSEEAFIDLTENVIQIIDPPKYSTEEISDKVSFSLYMEMCPEKSSNIYNCKEESDYLDESKSVESLIESNMRNKVLSEEEIINKKIYSGMTTIGPMKNINHDPKDLTATDIDFGKMTRITSSRQLAKEFFGVEIKSAPSIKITEDDSDEEPITHEGGNIDNATLVNRDIASLTKVQKVREVMSHHPKLDDDFEDDDTLTRPRLDLKDVESMTDERCKVPDVSIQLLSFEVGDNNTEIEQEFIQNVNLVLSRNRFDAHNFYEEDTENIQTQKNNNITEINNDILLDQEQQKEESNKSFDKKVSVKSENENFTTNFITKTKSGNEIFINSTIFKKKEEKNLETTADSQIVRNPSQHKCNTLGNVFKKASSKLIKKDFDFSTRNSKSLPFDTNKVTRAENMKSILDDCHTSTTNVLKKSHSLLKNTQEIFKSISQNRFNYHKSATNINKDKLSPSELDVRNPEKKSSFIKKEDFLKAKQVIKEKMEKAFKNLNITPRSESEGSLGKKEFDIKNDENVKTSQIENFKKLLPKSPLIYKSQFVKSQINVQKNVFEKNEMISSVPEKKYEEPKDTLLQPNEDTQILVPRSHCISSENEKIIKEEGNNQVVNNINDEIFWIENKEFLNVERESKQEEQLPEFIEMETVQGLQTTNLESSSTLEEKPIKTEQVQFLEEIGSRDNFISAHSVAISDAQLQIKNDNLEKKSMQIYNKNKDKYQEKIQAEKKVRTKSKKFTARFRSFWCSAFGRVKSSSRNARNHS